MSQGRFPQSNGWIDRRNSIAARAGRTGSGGIVGRTRMLSASNPTIWRTLAPRNKPNQLALCGSRRSSPPVETNNCPRPGFRPHGESDIRWNQLTSSSSVSDRGRNVAPNSPPPWPSRVGWRSHGDLAPSVVLIDAIARFGVSSIAIPCRRVLIVRTGSIGPTKEVRQRSTPT
jgi:hypothetical protein